MYRQIENSMKSEKKIDRGRDSYGVLVTLGDFKRANDCKQVVTEENRCRTISLLNAVVAE